MSNNENSNEVAFLACEDYYVAEQDDEIIGVLVLNTDRYFVFRPIEGFVFTCRQLHSIFNKLSELNTD